MREQIIASGTTDEYEELTTQNILKTSCEADSLLMTQRLSEECP
jgi:hypothetical protein